MNFLNQFQCLGELALIDVYEFYDKPLLFSCRSQTGQLYLAISVDDDDDLEIWYFAPLSLNRLQKGLDRQIDLYHVFANTESKFVFQISLTHSTQTEHIELIQCQQISEDNLPLQGEYLGTPLEQQLTIEGTLVGANIHQLDYEFWAENMDGTPVIYAGRVANSALDFLKGAILNYSYTATLLKKNTLNFITGEIEQQHELLALAS